MNQSGCTCSSGGSPRRPSRSDPSSPSNRSGRNVTPQPSTTIYSADILGLHNQPPQSFDGSIVGAPQMPFNSTPADPYNIPGFHESYGSQIDYNLSYMSSHAEFSDLPEPPSRISPKRQGQPAKYANRDPNVSFAASSMDSQYYQRSSDMGDSRFSNKQAKSQEKSTSKHQPKRESLIEWFDRSVEKELKKHREGCLNVGENLVNLEPPPNQSMVKEVLSSRSSNPLIVEASVSGIDIPSRLRKDRDTELWDAVEKLAKAEAMISFEGAVKAAEEAAAAAPPEFAEDAAAAGAQGFQAELTGIVKHEFSGSKPIEVVGYVGITRPKKPKKSNCEC